MIRKPLNAPYLGVLATAALAMTLAFSLAQADGDEAERAHEARGVPYFHGPGPGFGLRGIGRLMEALDLTPEQRDEVRDILEQARPRMRELRTGMRENMQALFELSPTDADYSSTVARASQEAGQLVSEMILYGSQVRTEIYSVLTAEQQARLPELKAEMRERFRERAERFHERRHRD